MTPWVFRKNESRINRADERENTAASAAIDRRYLHFVSSHQTVPKRDFLLARERNQLLQVEDFDQSALQEISNTSYDERMPLAFISASLLRGQASPPRGNTNQPSSEPACRLAGSLPPKI